MAQHTGRWHINKHGVPAPCHAKPGNCPLGGHDEHFKTAEDAQAHVDKLNMEQYGLLAKTVEDLTERLEKVEHVILPPIEEFEASIEVGEFTGDSGDTSSEISHNEYTNPAPITQKNGELKTPIVMRKEVQRELFNDVFEEVYGKAIGKDSGGISRDYLDESEDFANEAMLRSLDRSLNRLGSFGFINRESFKEIFISSQIEGGLKSYERYFKDNDLDYKWKRKASPAEERAISLLDKQCEVLGRSSRNKLVDEYNEAKTNGGILNTIKARRLASQINSFTELKQKENELERLKDASTTARFPEFFANRIRKDYERNPDKLEILRKHLTKRALYIAMKELDN